MMVERGWDPDLALAMMETLCGLDTIYDIPDKRAALDIPDVI